jgi:hypothetical protein
MLHEFLRNFEKMQNFRIFMTQEKLKSLAKDAKVSFKAL